MKRRRRCQGSNGLSISMTPLIDIVFLLLIFFMLASNFIEEQQFVVDLPQSAHGSNREKGALVVTVRDDGTILLGKRAVDEKGLEETLMALNPDKKAQGLEIRAERNTPVERIVKIMDVAKASRIKKVKITTKAQSG